jgi:hypothetical protein
MLTKKWEADWWEKTLPTRLKARGYPGTVMKYLFSIRKAGGILHSMNTVRFAIIRPKTVAADGGISGNNRWEFIGGV